MDRTGHITRRTLLGGTAALAVASALPAAAADEIVLGATVPLTGPLVASGQQYHYALQLAQDDINAAGGIAGKKLRIVFEDTQASNSVAVNAFVKLAQQHEPPFIFLSSYTTQNLATEPQVTKLAIPVMYAGGAVAVHERNNPWMFRLRPTDDLQALAMADALKTIKADKVGILHVQDDFGLGAANGLEKELTANGITVVGKESFGMRDNDFAPQLLALKNKGATALASFAYVRDGALVLQQRRSLGINLPYVAAQATVLPSTLDLLKPEDLEGVVSTTDAVLGETSGPASADYVKRFTARFNLRPDPFGSCYYDGAMIVAEAIRKVGTDRTKIRDYLAALKDYQGVTRIFYADAKRNLAHSASIVRFKPGSKDFELVARFPKGAK